MGDLEMMKKVAMAASMKAVCREERMDSMVTESAARTVKRAELTMITPMERSVSMPSMMASLGWTRVLSRVG